MTRPFMSPFVSPSLSLFLPSTASLRRPFSSNHAQEERGNVFLAGREKRAASAGCARANDWEMFLSPSSYLSLYAALHYLPGPQSDVFLSPHAYTSPRAVYAQNCWIFTGEEEAAEGDDSSIPHVHFTGVKPGGRKARPCHLDTGEEERVMKQICRTCSKGAIEQIGACRWRND